MFGPSYLKRMELETVAVHTKEGRSFRGVLKAVYKDAVVLSSAYLLVEAGGSHEVGEVVVPRDNLAFLQRNLNGNSQ